MSPDEIEDAAAPVEGAAISVSVNAYERSAAARQQCIDQYGDTCCICGLNFGEVYGKVADGFIHVHHLVPLSEIGRKYAVDPVEDLRPVCPNCHAVLHRRVPPFIIDEVREFLKQREKSKA